MLDRASSRRPTRINIAVLHAGRNIPEKITVAPANRPLVFTELHESRYRGITICFRQSIQGSDDLSNLALKSSGIRVFAIPQVCRLFRPGLDEYKQQVDGACEIPRCSFVLRDRRGRVTKANWPLAEWIREHGRS